MKLIEMTQQDFLETLSSDAPAPGGGSVAALAGSLGAALVQMTAALTAGKEKYAAHEETMQDTMKQARQLRCLLADIVDRDTDAFHAVSAVFAMPKDTGEQKEARKTAMQQALKACTQTPFEVMQLSLSALKLADGMLGGYNTNTASDLGVAVLALKAAIQGAWLNVLINIGGIHDDVFTDEHRKNGQEILDEALPLADKIYHQILESLL